MNEMRRINLNDGWTYKSKFSTEMIKKEYEDTEMEQVRIPHTNIVTPFHYFDESIYQFVSCYRRKIYVEAQG
ncbi:MAG TPA: hypothetical protein VJZ04_03975 [Lachnospiraceae bacterium]|nr:hypothetical protein [Lachnospiraceae bacterium]